MGGWEGGARGRVYGDICIHIADSLCYTAATNRFLKFIQGCSFRPLYNHLHDRKKIFNFGGFMCFKKA